MQPKTAHSAQRQRTQQSIPEAQSMTAYVHDHVQYTPVKQYGGQEPPNLSLLDKPHMLCAQPDQCLEGFTDFAGIARRQTRGTDAKLARS